MTFVSLLGVLAAPLLLPTWSQNRQNVIIDDLNGRTRLVRTDGLHKDSEQLILKVSYLFRR